jgi:hypothetical protein
VTDSGELTGTDQITVTIGNNGVTVSISSITYITEGGRNSDKHLRTTVALVDDLGNPVSGAAVSMTLANTNTSQSWSSTGTTGTDGATTFKLNNAPSGWYTTTVTNVVAEDLAWDGETPFNFYDKP